MDNTYKMKLIESGLFTKTYSSNSEYRGRCPFCGHKGNKFYIKIDLNSDDPVKYNCFHCPASGYLNYKLLERLGLDDQITLPKGIKEMKRLSVDTVVDTVSIDTVCENDDVRYISDWIYSKYNKMVNIDDLKSFQYIGNPSMYCSDYLGNDDIDSLREQRMWFKMVNGNIMGCNKNGDWRKYHSTRVHDGVIHQMKTMVDMYSDINLIICNDIWDSIGMYYNDTNELDNCMHVSVCGKQYIRGVRHMLSKGIFGKGVHIHMMVDSSTMDKTFIDNNLRKLFGKCFVYVNDNGDGYASSNINLHRIEKR